MKWMLVFIKFIKIKFLNLKSCEICIYFLKLLFLYKIRIILEMIENIMDLIVLILLKIRG